MKNFFYRLSPPRASFPADMTPEEFDAMRLHSVYWNGLLASGHAFAFGPVAGPSGSYGVAIVHLDDDADPGEVGRNDPAIQAGLGFSFEVHPMPKLTVQGR
jgi:hypothetical protein